ncbi:arabinofuranan 3-O-arabinosyltransferase [Thermomonospora echinospora]|uniref:Arabinofuranan 3-O-arabinosyltransferase n=1 Tax=Thermomonospora echinospora TaxID=1992 RepID=A0A1H5W4S2_9ACTN|nr:alpha-(1->3)-arabinofuranosyltransferase family protein [Thermomonospora echinospora]SEF94410.1 arabinofuranan 3-O-arabinosyltransferase [Thermomonospora echinospora]
MALGQAIRTGVDALAVRLADADREPAGPGPNGHRPAGGAEEIDTRLRDRLRLLACCLALTVLATSTRPGRILADTKIDMAVNPLGFLGRALHLWDPEQFGQLQNQAIGYWFPMGPFFALGDLVGMPAWITQRLWLSLLLCLAFLGTERLARRLGIGGPLTRLVAGLVYALAPGGLAVLGQISSEYLPLAMLPWIVLPLVTAVEGGGRIRAAARSGFAVACCGGINAAATAAVLVVPFLYLLTRPRGTPRIRLTAWWSAAVAMATAWWLVPLLLTGTYGFSWLTYTEKAETTTGPTGLVNVLRGAERWVNYLIIDGQVWWPVGHALSLDTLPVLCTGLVAALGLAGLLRSRLPERTFLLLTLLAGLTIMTAGHLSALEGPLAAPLRDLLDGPLAPIRNLHKFDGAVRLPLALGVAHVLASIPRARHRLRAVAVTYAALAGVAVTALSSGLSGPGDFRQVPGYWRDAAAWLNGRAGEQAVLALPGAPFGQYLWGRPMDDIMQPLLSARWGVRQLVPAGSPGYTRALDAIDQRVISGRGSPGLAEFLGRMGVRFVLVRNDLQREGLRGGWPARLHQALDGSPGLRRVAQFGPAVGQPTSDAIGSTDQRYPALEVYEVDDADDVVSVTDTADAIRLYGSPEALLTLADNGALRGRPVLLNDDAADVDGAPVVADSLRLTRRNFGELHQISPTLTPGERGRATDILDDGWDRYATTASYRGIRSVTSSASAADSGTIPQQHDLGRGPYSALDGDPSTFWQTGGWDGPLGQWLRVDFTRPTEPGRVTATFVQNADLLGPSPSRIAVETETGTIAQPVRAVSGPQALRVPPGATRWLRVRVLELAEPVPVPVFARVGIAELTVPGVKPERTLRLPAPDASKTSYALSRGPGRAAECMKGSANWVCSPSLERADEEGNGFDRTFTARASAGGVITGTATLIDNQSIGRYTTFDPGVQVTASSSRPHPAALARSAFDGDVSTVWIAAEDDTTPVYKVSWGRRVTLDRITVARPPGARGPLRVTLLADGGQTREGLVDERGGLSFAPLRTGSLTLTFNASVQPALQITDITIPGVRPLPPVTWTPLNLRCGWGPQVRVNGVEIPTKVTGAMGDLLEGRPVRFEACRRAPIAAGGNRLAGVPLSPYRIESAVVDTGALKDRGRTSAVTVERWTAETRVVEVDTAEESFLTVNENFNPGWRAEADGTTLRAVRLDGWKQGWIVPAGTSGPVTLTYVPDRAHKLAVLNGLSLMAVLALVAALPATRRRVPAGAPDGLGRFSARAAPAGDDGGARDKAARKAARTGVVTVLGALCAAGLGFWAAGFVGTAVCAAMAVAFAWAQGRRARAARILSSPWLVAGLMVAGALSWALGDRLRTTGNPAAPTDLLGDAIPQVLGLVIVARLVIGLWRPDPGPAAGTDGPPRRDDLRWRPPTG